jgi:hypothetical protein
LTRNSIKLSRRFCYVVSASVDYGFVSKRLAADETQWCQALQLIARDSGDLWKPKTGESPTFMIRALRDPDGANLDRDQMIKDWLDKDGEMQERLSMMLLFQTAE